VHRRKRVVETNAIYGNELSVQVCNERPFVRNWQLFNRQRNSPSSKEIKYSLVCLNDQAIGSCPQPDKPNTRTLKSLYSLSVLIMFFHPHFESHFACPMWFPDQTFVRLFPIHSICHVHFDLFELISGEENEWCSILPSG
jgi:hypothetical protein